MGNGLDRASGAPAYISSDDAYSRMLQCKMLQSTRIAFLTQPPRRLAMPVLFTFHAQEDMRVSLRADRVEKRSPASVGRPSRARVVISHHSLSLLCKESSSAGAVALSDSVISRKKIQRRLMQLSVRPYSFGTWITP
jgi:hypothetical protein